MLFWSKFPISTWVHFLLQVTISPKNLFLNNSLRKARPISKSASHQMPLNRKVATYAPIRGAPAWPCAKKLWAKYFEKYLAQPKLCMNFRPIYHFWRLMRKVFASGFLSPLILVRNKLRDSEQTRQTPHSIFFRRAKWKSLNLEKISEK